MAKRLATEYVQTRLQLSEVELIQFCKLWAEQQIASKIKVLDNGTQEVVFIDRSTGEEVTVTFERKPSHFEMSKLRVSSPKVADLLRKAVIRYKGDAVVQRIYAGFTIVYWYEKGTVVKIMEKSQGLSKVIFEYRNRLEELQQLYRQDQVEMQISQIRKQADELLDQRLRQSDVQKVQALDEQLSALAQQLFILEA